MDEKIKDIIKNEINPMLAADGGSAEFASFENGIVKVKLMGACSSCPFSQMTLKNLVEEKLKEKIKEVKSVEAV